MYQALYRKWRPRSFDDVVGQEQVTNTLKNQVSSGRLSHAYLFVGTRGTGKTTCAKILARAVNCENPQNGNPCNKCKSCLGIEDGSIMDVLELDAASNNGVDNVRALRDEAVFSPAIVKKRVYIIDEVHMLSTPAFNALLKILEEPPEHLMFILATTELNKVPATILSRCQRHSFHRVDRDVIASRLSYVASQEQMKIAPDAAALLARLADGSLRDGLSLLDQCSGIENITSESILSSMGLAGSLSISQLLNHISSGNTAEALTLFAQLWREGKSPATMLSELSTLLRDTLLTQLSAKGGSQLLSGSYGDDILESFAKKLTAEEMLVALDSVSACIGKLRDGRDPKLAAELCLISLAQPDMGESLESLRARVSRLEAKLSSGDYSHSASAAAKPALLPNTIKLSSEQKNISQQQDIPPFDIAPSMDEAIPFHKEMPPFEEAPPAVEKKSSSVEETSQISDVSEAPPHTDAADDDCKLFLSALMKAMPVFLQVHLKDAMCQMENQRLIISVDSIFKLLQLEQAQAQEAIRNTITQVFGRTLPFKLVEAKPTSPNASNKLDALSKFGNVKFE